MVAASARDVTPSQLVPRSRDIVLAGDADQDAGLP